MPPYDRRSRQRGFNTRIPINTLSGGVGRQAPSKRLPTEAEIIDNATPTLEKSIEKRANSNQLTTYNNIAASVAKDYGGLGLPGPVGANATLTIPTIADVAATSEWTFTSIGVVSSTIKLISTDLSEINYVITKLGNSGFLTESITNFIFIEKATNSGTITIKSYDGTSKTFVGVDGFSGTAGALNSDGHLQFNSGEGTASNLRAEQAALNFQEALYSANGFNNNASLNFTFNAAAVVDETITLTSYDNTIVTYQSKANGTVTNGDLAGSNVVFNAGTSGTEAATNLEAAINSSNGHNATFSVGTATWTFNTGTPAAGSATITLGFLTNLGTVVNKTYVAASSGSNGDLDGSNIKFLRGNSANEVASNLKQAILNKNGHGIHLSPSNVTANTGGVAASTTFTFTGAAETNGTLSLIDAYGTTKVYKAIASCSDCPKLNSGNIEFFRGTNKVEAARNFAEAVNSSVGHNGKINAIAISTGKVILTQTESGTVGNTTVTSASSWDNATNPNPTNFTSGAGGGNIVVTQAYGGTSGNTTITDSIDFVAACSVNPPATFTGGASGGSSGTKFTVVNSSGALTLTNVNRTTFSTSRVNLSAKFTDSLSVLPSARFGKMHCEVIGSQVILEQTIGGDTGNTAVTTANNFTDSLFSSSVNDFSRSSLTYINRGTTVTDLANQFKTAVESTAGHNGKITVVTAVGKVTLTQTTAGPNGNTNIVSANSFDSSITGGLPIAFTGGGDLISALNNEVIQITDVEGNKETFTFQTSTSNSSSSVIGIKSATTGAMITTEVIKAINLNSVLNVTASSSLINNEVYLVMDNIGGNGNTVTSSSSSIDDVIFARGSLTGADFYYYWFSVSDTLRYLLVVNYTATVGEPLFYVYKIDTETNKIEDQTPTTFPDPSVYSYITHKNESKKASEALEGITIGTNIYILNKFVKAGYSSKEDGYLFNLNGETKVPNEIDYKGKEIIYYTSSLVDPEGIASLYIPNKAYSAGTEVYTATGVWKAVTDIRAESTNTFSAADTSETVTPADPGPPDYLTSSNGASTPDLDYNIWYPYTATSGPQNPAAIAVDGKNRIQLNVNRTSYNSTTQTAATEWAEGMTPSVQVGDTLERKWKETVKSASGIETTEGDLVYDTNHSRKVADKGDGTDVDPPDTATGAQDDEYITLWQYMRPVEQIPVQDNRYVSRVKQYLGQSLSDFSNVKLPPHPSDPIDIIDKVAEIDRYAEGNRTGDAARTIGILYEDKSVSDYDDENNTTHEFGLGKILFIENSYAGLNPGYYRIESATVKPYITKVRTPFKYSRFDENRMPHKMSFIPPSETENARWDLKPENWTMRVSGDADTNPGPKMFEDGKQVEIKAMGFFRNRLWLAGEDKVFSSKLNEINNMWIDDPTSLTDEDPIDITCSYNKYTEVVSLTPFENFLFVNTASDVQFTLKGSDNQITPFTAEISPTSFYSTAPLVQPVLLGSQIYFFDSSRLYVYFNEKTVSINSAIEVSYHCPNFLPKNFGASAVVSPYDTLLIIDKDNPKDVYCYTNRYSGEQVIQNAFFKYSYNNNVENIHCWDTDIYSVVQTQTGNTYLYHVVKQPFKQLDYNVPLCDNSKTITVSSLNTVYDSNKDTTTFTFDSYYNPKIDSLNIISDNSFRVSGETLEIQSQTFDAASTKITVNGKYTNEGLQINVGTKFKTVVELSPVYYRDEANNVVDGILSLRTMHIRHHNTGNYRVEVTRQGRTITPIVFTSKKLDTFETMPLNRYSENGETVSKILGFGDEVTIQLISDYTTPVNITNIELKGRFNATYSSWVR